jgi:glutathione S-transferase
MKLYYDTGTCSLAPHIAIREAGLPVTLVRFDRKTRSVEGGGTIEDVNEKGYVPVLVLDDGSRLTEVAAILQYVADRAPAKGLAPANGTMARYQLQEWLNFLGMEVHKIYWPLFHDGAEVEMTKAREKLGRSFAYVSKKLGDRPFLFGDGFTVVDAFLVTLLNWAKAGGIDLAQWPNLAAYRTRMRERPGVMAALEAEGLTKRKA